MSSVSNINAEHRNPTSVLMKKDFNNVRKS